MNTEAIFLDVDIKLQGKILHTRTYNKHDPFSFVIDNFPDLSENILKKSDIYGQVQD